MKLAITILLVFFLILPVAFSQTNDSGPFLKAKEMALKCLIQPNGDRLCVVEISKDGELLIYRIIYGNAISTNGKPHEVIIIMRIHGNKVVAIGHCFICDDYKYYITGMQGFEELGREKAIDGVYRMFMEMVENKLT